MNTKLGRALLAGLIALPVTLCSTAAADGSQVARHYERDTMGSTIAAHENIPDSHARPRLDAGLPGIDISHFQGAPDWAAVAGANRFVYMKASEGTTYLDPTFGANYANSANAGMVRGAYHFGLPDVSDGATQAQYFVDNGGGWTADGKTLPPMLDIEYNPYGDTCYGLDPAAMSQWIADFSNKVHELTGRFPTIYSTTDWWNTCTGSNPNFAAANPLFVARYAGDVGELPAGWTNYTMWQYSSTGTTPGIGGNVDQDTFNGDEAGLAAFANGA